jgi:flagellar biosynthetic protein FliP
MWHILVAAVIALALPSLGLAQDAASSRPSAAIRPTVDNMPGAGDLLKLVDKSAPREGQGGEWSAPIRLAAVFTVLALLPSLLVMVTSFTRIVIVLAFIRRALTTQSIPPTVAIVGLAFFLTLFTMSATFGKMNDSAIQPYLRDEIPFEEACTRGSLTLKQFMLRQTREDDLSLFVKESGLAVPASLEDLPAHVVIPAFAISEFRTAFEIGCLLFLPFLLVDLVISGILLSAGMMMLPPSMISLPFKIILFVLVDGWRLVSSSLISGFR